MPTLADLLRGMTPSIDDAKAPDNYYGYQVRKPYESESNYFRINPHVAGMATEDNQITFNPFAPSLSDVSNRDAVGRNEAARLWMREKGVAPNFPITPTQQSFFSNTEYAKDPVALRQSVLGRILSGDPSAQDSTDQQKQMAYWLLQNLQKR
tara:strand:+ start:26302 stop:26757 length:456 start_codon:yes stop_codon:yes gene_type:complete